MTSKKLRIMVGISLMMFVFLIGIMLTLALTRNDNTPPNNQLVVLPRNNQQPAMQTAGIQPLTNAAPDNSPQNSQISTAQDTPAQTPDPSPQPIIMHGPRTRAS